MKKTITRLAAIVAVAIYLVNGYGLAQGLQQRSQTKPLLYWAEKLQQNINAQNTKYQHKDNVISWGDDGNGIQCYTDCSGFINALLTKSYNWKEDDFKAQFGHKRMFAYHYYDVIYSGNHFQQIKNINDIIPGDVIALKYADRSEHDDNTGHVMLIVSRPRSHKPSKILEPNTLQYEVEIIDCSKSPHGKSDSRFTPDGREYSGLGKGLFRLYTDNRGNIVAYSWSIFNPKEGFNPFENSVIVGRFLPNN